MSLGVSPEIPVPLRPQVVIPVVSVQMIKKHKMARLLPNGLAITTNTSQKVSESPGQPPLVSLPSQPQDPDSGTLSSLYLPHPFLFSFSVPVRLCVTAFPGQCI